MINVPWGVSLDVPSRKPGPEDIDERPRCISCDCLLHDDDIEAGEELCEGCLEADEERDRE